MPLPRVVGLIILGLGTAAAQAAAQHPRAAERDAMVDLIERMGVRDSTTLAAMRSVPRHDFVPAEHQRRAYGDYPIPIGLGQTISQPYIVAYMTELVRPKPGLRILEVGTGSGYQAAILAATGATVYTVEIFGVLAERARERLARLGYSNVTVRHGDGHDGWIEHAAFDAVLVTAAAGYIPPALTNQLKPTGRMVIPVGSVYGIQSLILVEKDERGELTVENLLPVRFVPMLKGIR